jgi:hypothetical protein
MSHKLIDENGVEIKGKIRIIFVCDMCGNTADFYHGMSTYAKTIGDKVTSESYCSEICARKAVATEKEIYMCAYCDTEMTNGTHCVPCNEYDGAMPKAEWEQLQRELKAVKS